MLREKVRENTPCGAEGTFLSVVEYDKSYMLFDDPKLGRILIFKLLNIVEGLAR